MESTEFMTTFFARLALGFSVLSAVADRFGLWGPHAAQHVAWGDFALFITYTATLNWFLPQRMIPASAWLATSAEVVLGIALVLGLFTRTAFLCGLLLFLFALSMAAALGLESPLDASVFSASAFLLSTAKRYPFSADSIVRRSD